MSSRAWIMSLAWWCVTLVGCGESASVVGVARDGAVTFDAPRDELGGMDVSAVSDAKDASPDVDASARDDVGGDVSAPAVDVMAPCYPCPDEWVPYARGGCGPAVLLCTPDGGAAPGACVGRDVSVARPVKTPTGATVVSFHRRPDGSIGGGWPASTWRPVAGVASCAAGWSRVGDVCDPSLSTACAAGTMPLPGGACSATGDAACGGGDFPGLPEGVTATPLFVRAGAPATGADGTQARPFPTINAALERASFGGWILIAAGTYREAVLVSRDIHLVGLCAQRVRLEGAASATPAVDVVGAGTTAVLQGFALEGGRPGVRARGGASVSIREARVSGAAFAALHAQEDGSVLEATDVVVTGTRPRTGEAGGYAVLAAAGGRFVGQRLHLADNTDAAVRVTGASSSARVTEVVVTTTGARETAGVGPGFAVDAGAALRAERFVVERSTGAGIRVTGVGARVTLADGVIRLTAPRGDMAWGDGVRVEGGAGGDLRRIFADRNVSHGVLVRGATSVVTVADSVASDTRDNLRTDWSGGFFAEENGALRGARLIAARNAVSGAAVTSGASIELEDVVLQDGRMRGDAIYGWGLWNFGGVATLRRALIANNITAGVGTLTAGSVTVVTDAVIRGSRTEAEPGIYVNGNGISVGQGARVEAERVLLFDNQTTGAVASNTPSLLVLRDSAIEATTAQADGALGAGTAAVLGATVNLEHVLLSDLHELGVGAGFRRLPDGIVPSYLFGDDVLVVRVQPSSGRGFGTGVGASAGASIRLGRVAVDGAAGAAVFAAHYNLTAMGMPIGSQVRIEHLFARDIAPSTTALRPDGALLPSGPRNAFGIYGGIQSVTDVGDATLDGVDRAFGAEGTVRVGRAALSDVRLGVGVWATTTSGTDRIPEPSAFCRGEGVQGAIEAVAVVGAVQLPIAPPPGADAGM